MKRKKINSHKNRARLSVFKSSRYIYAQIIDDQKGRTLAAASNFKENKGKNKIESAVLTGSCLAKKALAKGIKKVWFNRGRYRYHGRVKALAEGARKGGLDF